MLCWYFYIDWINFWVFRRSSFTIIIVCVTLTTLWARTFCITNNCDQKIWFGVQGELWINNGRFEINTRSSTNIDVPDEWVCIFCPFLLISKVYWLKTNWKVDEFGHELDVNQRMKNLNILQVSDRIELDFTGSSSVRFVSDLCLLLFSSY
jgi:hypothetical protein